MSSLPAWLLGWAEDARLVQVLLLGLGHVWGME
jgi:hypothetical protein